MLSKIATCYHLQNSWGHFSFSSKTAHFCLFLRTMKNFRCCLQLIIPTQPKISRQKKTLILFIPPTCLALFKLKMSRKTTMLFQVLRNRWTDVNELVLFFKTVWDNDYRASKKRIKAVPYNDLKQICATIRIRHVFAMIFLHNGNVVWAHRTQELRYYIGYRY